VLSLELKPKPKHIPKAEHGSRLLLFIGWTWVTGAVKDEGTTESCSTATLMSITSTFYKLLFSESIWSEKACQVLCVKVTLVQGSTVKINTFLCLF
jgi:hypothetical protein